MVHIYSYLFTYDSYHIHIYSDPSFSIGKKRFFHLQVPGGCVLSSQFTSRSLASEKSQCSIRHRNLSGKVGITVISSWNQVIDELPSFASYCIILPYFAACAPLVSRSKRLRRVTVLPTSRPSTSRDTVTSGVWGFATLAGGLFGSPRSDHPGEDVKKNHCFTAFHIVSQKKLLCHAV